MTLRSDFFPILLIFLACWFVGAGLTECGNVVQKAQAHARNGCQAARSACVSYNTDPKDQETCLDILKQHGKGVFCGDQ